jgi:hypothetical protein
MNQGKRASPTVSGKVAPAGATELEQGVHEVNHENYEDLYNKLHGGRAPLGPQVSKEEAELLAQLQEQMDRGEISAAEFNARKRRLLRSADEVRPAQSVKARRSKRTDDEGWLPECTIL